MNDEPTTSRTITRDEALFWLNDRLGQRMGLNVTLERGDYFGHVLSATGELRHTVGGRPPIGHVGAAIGETLMGLYNIGGCDFDLSERVPYVFAVREWSAPAAQPPHAELPHAELVIDVAPGVEVAIMAATDLP
jgi:hypothetical protein